MDFHRLCTFSSRGYKSCSTCGRVRRAWEAMLLPSSPPTPAPIHQHSISPEFTPTPGQGAALAEPRLAPFSPVAPLLRALCAVSCDVLTESSYLAQALHTASHPTFKNTARLSPRLAESSEEESHWTWTSSAKCAAASPGPSKAQLPWQCSARGQEARQGRYGGVGISAAAATSVLREAGPQAAAAADPGCSSPVGLCSEFTLQKQPATPLPFTAPLTVIPHPPRRRYSSRPCQYSSHLCSPDALILCPPFPPAQTEARTKRAADTAQSCQPSSLPHAAPCKALQQPQPALRAPQNVAPTAPILQPQGSPPRLRSWEAGAALF